MNRNSNTKPKSAAGRPKGSKNKDQNKPKVLTKEQARYKAKEQVNDEALKTGQIKLKPHWRMREMADKIKKESVTKKKTYVDKRDAKVKTIKDEKKAKATANKKAREAAMGKPRGGSRPGAGAKPHGDVAMTAAERQKKSRQKKKEILIKEGGK